MPLGIALTQTIRVLRPFAGSAIGLYGAVQPEGDRRLLGRPEFRAMFIDDLLNGSRKQITAAALGPGAVQQGLGLPPRRRRGAGPLVARRRRPHRALRPWQHCVERLPDAELFTMSGESHLGGLGMAMEILHGLLDLA